MSMQSQAPTPSGRTPVQSGEVRDIALNKLKASSRNVRRVSHSADDIESRAASIRAKGLLQPLVVEPEIRDGGQESGYYLVTIGEGRRQALKLLAKRKLIGKAELVRCVVDTTNDPSEISLDENVSRRDMHPADQFEAFKDLAERKGYGAEEIGARFGVKPDIVRQRLRLGSVAPALLDLYREATLTLEQVMAFAVNPDPERQMQVYAQMPQYHRQAFAIRRAMTETKVSAEDRRVQYVGLDDYVAAGGAVLRDLFSEDGGGWVEDVVLLDRLVLEKLEAVAVTIREDEGWKWSAAYLDSPSMHGCARVWEHVIKRSAEDIEAITALQTEEAALVDQWADVEPPPAEVEARFKAIADALDALGETYGFDPDEKARGGVFVVLNSYGEARIERGFVRPEDVPAPQPQTQPETDSDDALADPLFDPDEDGSHDGSLDGGEDDADGQGDEALANGEVQEPVGNPAAPLPDRVVAELTAHRSAALRDALAQAPDLAQLALVHALVNRVFGLGGAATCLDIRWGSRDLSQFGEGIEDSVAGQAIGERHRLWARQMPTQTEDFWDFVVGLDGDSRAALLAHCVSLTLDGVKSWERRPQTVLAHVETLATALDLDMRAYWKPTAVRYLDRVTKAQIVGAVTDGVSVEAAARLSGLKKPDMVAAAEPLLVEAGWLPALLRTAKPAPVDPTPPDAASALEDGDEPLDSLDDAVGTAPEQSPAEAAEVEALLTRVG
jgi:ParB family chromosome partitioning protein